MAFLGQARIDELPENQFVEFATRELTKQFVQGRLAAMKLLEQSTKGSENAEK